MVKGYYGIWPILPRGGGGADGLVFGSMQGAHRFALCLARHPLSVAVFILVYMSFGTENVQNQPPFDPPFARRSGRDGLRPIALI